MKKRSRDLDFIIVLIIFILIIGFSAIYILMLNSISQPGNYLVSWGFLDLRDWDGKGLVRLDGQWEFYPNQLLEPGELGQAPGFIEVPSSIKGYVDDPRDGGGTYRLKLTLPDEGIYAISIRGIRQASRVYFNGKELVSFGQVSLDMADFLDGSGHRIVFISGQEVELVIQLASFSYRSAGIISSLELGREETILGRHTRAIGLESLTIVISLALGAYFFIEYLNQPSFFYMTYLGLVYIFMALYLSTLGEELLNLVFSYSYLNGQRIQLFSLLMISNFLLLAFNGAFPGYASLRFLSFLRFLVALASISLIIGFDRLPPMVEGAHRGMIFLVFSIILLYVSYLTLRVVINRENYYSYLFLLSLSIVYQWFISGLEFWLNLNTGYIKLLLMVYIFISLALLLGRVHKEDRLKLFELTKKLEEEDGLKSIFLSRLVGELRKPLSRMKKELEDLSQGRVGLLSSQQQMRLHYLNLELVGLSGISDELIKVAQIGGSTIFRSPLDPGPILEELGLELVLMLGEEQDLLIDLPEDLPLILANHDGLVHILYNLFANALDNTQKGQISFKVEAQGDFLVFTIRDRGQGIPRRDLDRIFEIFYRVEGRESHGLGLGLSIVRLLVEAQGGTIDVVSSPEEGTQFSFSLPIFKGSLLGTGGQLPKLDLEGFSKSLVAEERCFTVLIYGVSQEIERSLERLLESGPFKLCFSRDESEAQAYIDQGLVNFVIVDYGFHHLSKSKLLGSIRERFSPVELPVLGLVSPGKTMEFIEVLEKGANDYLKKPLDSVEFISRFQALLMMKLSVEKNMEREFKYSYMEISPHFLYNTLNTIIAISYDDGEKTRRALKNLATYFRGKLGSEDRILISLKEELKLVYAYLEIEKMRFEDLEIILEIDKDLNPMIPALSLQPLVENCLAHGLRPKKTGSWLRIETKEEEGFTLIAIEDNGRGIDEKKCRELLAGRDPGLGFSNVMSKLKMIRGASLDLTSALGQGTRIEIRLPR